MAWLKLTPESVNQPWRRLWKERGILAQWTPLPDHRGMDALEMMRFYDEHPGSTVFKVGRASLDGLLLGNPVELRTPVGALLLRWEGSKGYVAVSVASGQVATALADLMREVKHAND